MDYKHLAANYRRSPPTTAKEKALAERAVWESIPKEIKAKAKKDKYAGKMLKDLLGGPEGPSVYGVRQTLLKKAQRGLEMGPAWEALDRGEVAGNVKTLVNYAEGKARVEKRPYLEELTKALNSQMADKSFVRTVRSERAKNTSVKEKTPARKGSTREKSPPREKTSTPDDRPSLYGQLRKLIRSAESPEEVGVPEGVDPQVYKAAYHELVESVRVILDQSRKDFHEAKRRHDTRPKSRRIGSGKLREACEVLDISPPKRGSPVDEKVARKSYLKVAVLCHPDRNHGSDEKTHLFHEATNAFEIIKNYNQTLS